MANPTCPTSTWWRLMAPRKKSPKTMMTTRKSTLRPTAMLRCWLRVVSTLIAYWDPWLLEFPYVWTHPTLGSYTYSIYLIISLYISIILYILHRTCMFNPFPHIGSLFSSAVHFLPGMFTSKYLKCLMMYSGLLAINYPILSTQNRDFHIHPHIPCFFYLFMVMTGGWFIIVLTTLIWVNYNDLTATSLELWLVIGIIPEKPYFRLVNYCNLPRLMEHIHSYSGSEFPQFLLFLSPMDRSLWPRCRGRFSSRATVWCPSDGTP